MKKVSVVIGLYNSEKTIGSVIEELQETFQKQSGYDYEIILVDDHSPDNVFEVAKRMTKENKKIKVIHLAKNSGQTNAVIEGYKYATGDFIVEMDDDYQMPGYEIPRMVKTLEDGNYDVVFAKYKEQKENLFRRIGSKLNNKTSEWSVGKPKGIRINSFFIMRKFVKDSIIQYSNNYPYVYGIIFATTQNIANMEVEHRERKSGKSNYTTRALTKLWINGMLNFSVQPLRLSIKFGFLVTVIGVIAAIILLIQRLISGTQVLGWTSLMIAIILFSGVQLMSIGMLGEYLGRLYISKSGLPRATIKEVVDNEKITNSEDKNE